MPVLGESSHDAARVAVALHAQAPEKYLEFHRQMLGSDQQADGQAALNVAKKLGLDMNKLAEGLADPEVDATLLEVHELAQKLNIEGTPTYVVGDQVVPGAVGVANLKEIIGNVRSCGKATCS
jgi:protein-disulfide isomerase